MKAGPVKERTASAATGRGAKRECDCGYWSCLLRASGTARLRFKSDRGLVGKAAPVWLASTRLGGNVFCGLVPIGTADRHCGLERASFEHVLRQRPLFRQAYLRSCFYLNQRPVGMPETAGRDKQRAIQRLIGAGS